ncbi:MAG: DUF2949 domain-containing protein [Cyanobacteria bacterium M_surface_10_m2_119]|jgi:hypothetical protein|nr:DUF2949 domain-containing protein [Cyanobacteria bacterium M_surface_10_m2_119]
MVLSSAPPPPPSPALQRFLRSQVGLSESALALGIRQAQLEQAPLAVVLWRFGLINLQQFDLLLQWQDANL